MKLQPSLDRALSHIIHQQPPLVPPVDKIDCEEIREMKNYSEFLYSSLQDQHPESLEYIDNYLSYARLMRQLDRRRPPDEVELVQRLNEIKRLREVLKNQLNQTA